MFDSLRLFRERVRAEIDRQGLDDKAAAARAGIAASTFSLYLNGKKKASLPVVDRIADALSTTPSALLDPGTPAVPPHLEDIVKILSHAPPPVLDAVRALLMGYAKGVETDPPPSSRPSLPEHREDLPEKRKHRGK